MKLFRDSERAKYAASRLPSTWPSYLHNKCNVPTCYFPNSPQAVDGTYNCLGLWKGRCCEGTYYVSPSSAASVTQIVRDQMMRDEQARKWKTQKDAEIERQKIVKSQLDEEATRMAAEELSAKYEEKRKNKDASTGSTAYNHSLSSYLARRAAQRRSPTDINLTDATTEQKRPPSPTYDQVYYLELHPSTVHDYKAPIDLIHSPQISSRASSSRSKSSTKHPSPSFGYSSPQLSPPRF